MAGLKGKRVDTNLSIKEVSEKLKISRITLWQYENGKRKPSFETLCKLANIYGCTVNDFVDKESISKER